MKIGSQVLASHIDRQAGEIYAGIILAAKIFAGEICYDVLCSDGAIREFCDFELFDESSDTSSSG